MREEKQNRDREHDRVTRRSGEKIFADASASHGAEPARGTSHHKHSDTDAAPRRRDRSEQEPFARDEARSYREEPSESRARRATQEPEKRSREGVGRDKAAPPERRVAEKDRVKVRSTAAGSGGGAEVFWHQVVPYAMFWVALFAAVSFILRDLVGRDGSVGAFGEWLANVLCGIFGIGAYILPLFLIVLALKWRQLLQKRVLGKKIILSTLFILLLSGIIHVFLDADRAGVLTGAKVLYYGGVARTGGGFFGGFVGEWLGFCFRLPGTCLLAIPLLVIIGIYLLGFTPVGLWQRIDTKLQMMRQHRRELRGAKVVSAPARGARETSPAAAEKKEPARWKEPQPLTRTGVTIYDFHEDEPDVIVEPVPRRAAKRDKEPLPAEEPTPRKQNTDAVRVQRNSDINEILDIPDDEPVYPVSTSVAPEVPAPTPQQSYTVQGATFGTPSTAAAPAQPPTVSPQPQAAAEPLKEEQGNYYAPFALPVRPEPKRERATEAGAHIVITPHAVDETPARDVPPAPMQRDVRPVQTSEIFEEGEVLGSNPPPFTPEIHYEPAAAAAPSAQPYESTAGEMPPVLIDEDVPQEEALGVADEAETPVALSSLFELEDDEPETAAPETADAPITPAFERKPLFEEEPVAASAVAGSTFAWANDEAVATPLDGARREETVSSVLEEEPILSDASADDTDDDMFFAPPVGVMRERVDPTVAAVAPSAAVFTAPAPSRYEPPRETPAVRHEPVRDETPPAPEVVRKEYVRPPITLLNEDKNVRNQDFYEEIEDTKQILRDTLESFNIHIQDDVAYSHGPSVTRYELRPVAGTSVRSVTNRIEDLSLNLASSVRIEAPIPGKPAIGIEVPNKVRETVYMRTMLESPQFKNSTEPLEVPIGLDVGGEVRMCNIAKMPHLLVAGTTGSGKSVCINSILVSLIFKTSPEDLRLILIDPKQIEFAPYEHVPHLYMPIVTDMQRAAGALACAVQEMERRFTLIRDVGVRNIEAYNEAVKNDPDREHLPYMIIVIDEFADLKMSCSNNDPENFTCRIAQKARAAGIHLIIGTQRPSVDVITGKLKTNIPSRIAFMVKQQVDSRTILDVNGAESLTGRGDMLYMPTNSQDKAPTRIQGAFVSDGELERVVSFVRKNNDPVQYNQAFMDQIEVEMAKAQNNGKKADFDDFGDDDESGEDPKFVEAVKLAIDTQKVATSLLQRRLGVGYGRAAKIIDRMEELGLVSAPDGNKPRQILPAAQGYLNHLAATDEEGGDDFNDYGA